MLCVQAAYCHSLIAQIPEQDTSISYGFPEGSCLVSAMLLQSCGHNESPLCHATSLVSVVASVLLYTQEPLVLQVYVHVFADKFHQQACCRLHKTLTLSFCIMNATFAFCTTTTSKFPVEQSFKEDAPIMSSVLV